MFKLLNLKKKSKINQLPMELTSGDNSWIAETKSYVKNMEYKISVIPYWRNGTIWFAFIGILFAGITAVSIVALNFDKIPPQLPLLYRDTKSSWNIVSKEFLIIVPLVISLGSMSLFYLFPKLFYINKRLTLSLALCLLFANIALVVAVVELIFMVIN